MLEISCLFEIHISDFQMLGLWKISTILSSSENSSGLHLVIYEHFSFLGKKVEIIKWQNSMKDQYLIIYLK